MTTVRGCNLPEDLYYLIEKHVWAKPVDGGVMRVGMTAVAAKLSGGKLAAVTIRKKNVGQPVAQGKSVATVESSKYVGPVATPVSGTLLRGNEKLETDPNLAVTRSVRRGVDRGNPAQRLGCGKDRTGHRARWDCQVPSQVGGGRN